MLKARRRNNISDNNVENQWIEFCLHFSSLTCACHVSHCTVGLFKVTFNEGLRVRNKRCSTTCDRIRAGEENRKFLLSGRKKLFLIKMPASMMQWKSASMVTLEMLFRSLEHELFRRSSNRKGEGERELTILMSGPNCVHSYFLSCDIMKFYSNIHSPAT